MMAQAVRYARIPLCITDPHLDDNPIVYANAAFLDLVGYGEDEILGRNCRILQGPETTSDSVDAVRSVVEQRRVETVEILNYRKDGSSFVNALQIGPILDDDGQVLFFFGSQLDVTAKHEAEKRARVLAEEELVHRLRNIVNVMNVVIKMTAREEPDASTFGTVISERLRALSDAHFQTIGQTTGQGLTLDKLAQAILAPYAPSGIQQIRLDGPEVDLPEKLLSCMALVLHELAANSVKHGALSVARGAVDLDWSVQHAAGADKVILLWREKDGPAVVAPERESGSRIIRSLIAAVDGVFDMDWDPAGLIVRAEFPL
jgi:PAS domain S-box-containing protein